MQRLSKRDRISEQCLKLFTWLLRSTTILQQVNLAPLCLAGYSERLHVCAGAACSTRTTPTFLPLFHLAAPSVSRFSLRLCVRVHAACVCTCTSTRVCRPTHTCRAVCTSCYLFLCESSAPICFPCASRASSASNDPSCVCIPCGAHASACPQLVNLALRAADCVHALWWIVCTTGGSCAQPADCVHRGCARSDREHIPLWIVCAVGGREWPAVEMRHLPADQLAASDWMVKGQVVSRAEVLETFVRDALTDVTKIKVRPCVCAM